MKASEYLKQWRELHRSKPHILEDGPWTDGWSHSTYVNEVDKIADWSDPSFCYSKEQGFKGVGLVGMLGDIAMYSSRLGDILEIGVGTSSLYLTFLAKKYHRQLYHIDMDETKLGYGAATGVHIAPDSIILAGKSDEVFTNNKLTPLAFAFIDGSHEYEQAKRDFWNTEKYLIEDGYILLHDTYPAIGEDWIAKNMCWDCYRLRQDLEKDKRFDCLSFPLPGQIGFTLIRKKPLNLPYYQESL